jgi:hypothetical protein
VDGFPARSIRTGSSGGVDLNLVMPMLAAQLAVPLVINSGGSIINVSS